MSEPVGWNVYHMTRDLEGNDHAAFREFIPNEEALAPVAEALADQVEQWAQEGGS